MAKVKITAVPEDNVTVRIVKDKFQNGGAVNIRITNAPQYQTGGEPTNTVEAEGGEVYQDNTGNFVKIDNKAPSHEQGGVDVNDAERILEDTSTTRKDKYSKILKMSPDEVHSIFGFKPKSSVSHAKAFEVVSKEYEKQTDEFNKAQKDINKKGNLDKYSAQSAKLNFANRQQMPTPEDVFDTLFEHQEAIKAVHQVPDDGKQKYGGFKPKAQFGLGTKAKTPGGQYSTEGVDINKGPNITLDDYKSRWKDAGLDLDHFKTIKDAQRATYDFLANQDNPQAVEAVRDMWKQTGLTNLGRQNIEKVKKLGIEVAKNPRDPQGRLDVKDWDSLTPQQLSGLNELAYADNNFRFRTLVPSTQQVQQSTNPPAQAAPPAGPANPGSPDVNVNPNFTPRPENKFFEPTHWYDIAPGVDALVDSLNRDPELFNPVQLHQLKYKLMNPTEALNANEADYRAALDSLGNQQIGSGAAAANIANLTAQKYKANNQIVANYENQNTAIRNREIDYNTNVRDRQSMADAGSRATFYNNVLQARDNQRLQKLQAIQDLSRAMQLKARQNTSGNLVLKLSPHYNQQGEYNGFQRKFVLPDGQEIAPPAPKSKTTTTKISKVGDRTIRTVSSS